MVPVLIQDAAHALHQTVRTSPRARSVGCLSAQLAVAGASVAAGAGVRTGAFFAGAFLRAALTTDFFAGAGLGKVCTTRHPVRRRDADVRSSVDWPAAALFQPG